MCVIAFLIAAALFSSFYAPIKVSGTFTAINERPIDYMFFYRADENQIKKDEIFSLANDYEVEITQYYEAESIALIVDGNYKDYDDNGRAIETYFKKLKIGNFYSESEFNKISNLSADVKSGEYKTLTKEGLYDGYWSNEDDVSLITNPMTDISENITYAGSIDYSPLALDGMKCYVLSDEDYSRLKNDMVNANSDDKSKMYKYTLFNVKNPYETYEYAKALKNEIIKRSSEKSAIITSYDDYSKYIADMEGKEYWADKYMLDLSVDNNQLYTDWKYYPQFNVLNKQDVVKNTAVLLMLFIYIGIICFTAVSVIAYTRGITIGIDNKKLFMDLKKLGANDKYIRDAIKKQLAKIFIYPTVVGSISIYLLFFMIMYGNSGGISQGEMAALIINFVIVVAVCCIMWVVYMLTLKKLKKMVEI